MMRDVGIRYEKGKKPSLDEKNHLRQESDKTQLGKISGILNQSNIKFSKEELIVLGQPLLDDPDLYWKSTEDFLRFAVSVAVRRKTISGKCLLELFDEAKPSIMKIVDFSDPSIPFHQITRNTSNRSLTEASSAAIQSVEGEIHARMEQWNVKLLRAVIDLDFVRDVTMKCIHAFETKANELFDDLLDLSRGRSDRYRQRITQKVTEIRNALFVDRCISLLIPVLEAEIVNEIKDEIPAETASLPINEIETFPFATLPCRYE
jgi:hypothetical protein